MIYPHYWGEVAHYFLNFGDCSPNLSHVTLQFGI